MNEEDIKLLLEKQKQEEQALKKHIHKSINNIQSVIDKFTTKIYEFLEEDLKNLRISSKQNIIIYPNICFFANDIAPIYGCQLNIVYHINIFDFETNSFLEIINPQNTLIEKIEELQKQNIVISLEVSGNTKITLVKNFIWSRNGKKEH